MVSCKVRTSVLPIVKSNPPIECVYQLSYRDKWDFSIGFKCYVKFTTRPSYIGILMTLVDYIFLSVASITQTP